MKHYLIIPKSIQLLRVQSVLCTILFISSFFIASCNTLATIQNVQNSVPSGVTTQDIERAILKAGVQKQWLMTKVKDGEIEATHNIRSHSATVKINYDKTRYSIDYVSSKNLKQSGDKIHRNYNRWINNLSSKIILELYAKKNSL